MKKKKLSSKINFADPAQSFDLKKSKLNFHDEVGCFPSVLQQIKQQGIFFYDINGKSNIVTTDTPFEFLPPICTKHYRSVKTKSKK